jgi:hypothetical protein
MTHLQSQARSFGPRSPRGSMMRQHEIAGVTAARPLLLEAERHLLAAAETFDVDAAEHVVAAVAAGQVAAALALIGR